MVVFALDAAGNNAALSLQCTATGDPSPNITWFRGRETLGNNVVMADGSLLIENITEGVDATRGGLLYYCTANNAFGTIRSRAANVSYACEWEGKECVLYVWGVCDTQFVLCSLSDFDGFDGPNGIEVVNVSTGVDADVALECRVRGANPPPQIQWLDGTGTPLIEDRTNNVLRFLDNGRYLLIGQLMAAQVNANYYCSVTNVRLHETVRSPTTYDLNPILGTNEFMIYKRFINRTLILMGGGTTTVDLSYIVGAGSAVAAGAYGLLNCRRTITTNTTVDLSPLGGVIDETIPRMGENIPTAAESLTFEVRCNLVANGQTFPSRATLTVLGRC